MGVRVLTSHASTRMAERFGIPLTPALLRDIQARIEYSQGVLKVLSTDKRRNIVIYSMMVEGKWMKIVYDTKKKFIMTAIPVFDTTRWRERKGDA